MVIFFFSFLLGFPLPRPLISHTHTQRRHLVSATDRSLKVGTRQIQERKRKRKSRKAGDEGCHHHPVASSRLEKVVLLLVVMVALVEELVGVAFGEWMFVLRHASQPSHEIITA